MENTMVEIAKKYNRPKDGSTSQIEMNGQMAYREINGWKAIMDVWIKKDVRIDK